MRIFCQPAHSINDLSQDRMTIKKAIQDLRCMTSARGGGACWSAGSVIEYAKDEKQGVLYNRR